jgi:hypothetical protein
LKFTKYAIILCITLWGNSAMSSEENTYQSPRPEVLKAIKGYVIEDVITVAKSEKELASPIWSR